MNGSAPKKQLRIFIDAGHGGRDPGAIGAINTEANLHEADVALAISKRLESSILRLLPGALVCQARGDDRYVDLEPRVAAAEAFKADYFLSLHCNACTDPHASGFEIWTSRGQTQADALATLLFSALADAMGGHYGRADYDDGDPDKEANFYVLRHSTMPAVLIEYEFISNPGQAAFLADPETQKELADATAVGLAAYLDA